MKLRKINAGLSLITTILLMDHAMLLSVWMLSRCSIEKSAENMPYVLAALMFVHAVISIVLAILGHKGAKKIKVKSYPQLNRATMVQRITGILMILMLGLHIAGANNYYKPKMLHAVFHPIFFGIALAHAAVSTSKALITLGIGNAKLVKIVNVVMRVLCVVTFVACVTGFYLCLFLGVKK